MGGQREAQVAGLMWFKAADKGCGAYNTGHHAFVSWLTLQVWFTVVFGIVYLVFGLVTQGAELSDTADTDCDGLSGPALEFCELGNDANDLSFVMPWGKMFWKFLLNMAYGLVVSYVGYWAFSTQNKIFSIVVRSLSRLGCLLGVAGRLTNQRGHPGAGSSRCSRSSTF